VSYFPFFVDLQGKQCLVAGGGSVAYRKVYALLPFGVRIKVVSPKFCSALIDLAGETEKKQEKSSGEIFLCQREYQKSDLEDVLFAIAATDDTLCNREIALGCQEKNILVNVVDEPEQCSFYFPSLLKRGDFVVGVCSGGKSPVLSSHVRKAMEREVPEFYGQLNDNLGVLRPWVKEHLHTEVQRKQYYETIIQESRKTQRALSLDEMKEIV
jgi:siroheme synthase-like protein